MLTGSKDVIGARLAWRKGHFMPASLLDSQFDTLEEPDDEENHVNVDVTLHIDEIVKLVTDNIN